MSLKKKSEKVRQGPFVPWTQEEVDVVTDLREKGHTWSVIKEFMEKETRHRWTQTSGLTASYRSARERFERSRKAAEA